LGSSAMILMDTHIWLRWLLPDEPLSENMVKLIETADYLSYIELRNLLITENNQR